MQQHFTHHGFWTWLRSSIRVPFSIGGHYFIHIKSSYQEFSHYQWSTRIKFLYFFSYHGCNLWRSTLPKHELGMEKKFNSCPCLLSRSIGGEVQIQLQEHIQQLNRAWSINNNDETFQGNWFWHEYDLTGITIMEGNDVMEIWISKEIFKGAYV